MVAWPLNFKNVIKFCERKFSNINLQNIGFIIPFIVDNIEVKWSNPHFFKCQQFFFVFYIENILSVKHMVICNFIFVSFYVMWTFEFDIFYVDRTIIIGFAIYFFSMIEVVFIVSEVQVTNKNERKKWQQR